MHRVGKVNKYLATLCKIALVRMRNVFEVGRSCFADIYRHVAYDVGKAMTIILTFYSLICLYDESSSYGEIVVTVQNLF